MFGPMAMLLVAMSQSDDLSKSEIFATQDV